eukprot:358445-Chlamydomonas_euryale.AAC.20
MDQIHGLSFGSLPVQKTAAAKVAADRRQGAGGLRERERLEPAPLRSAQRARPRRCALQR